MGAEAELIKVAVAIGIGIGVWWTNRKVKQLTGKNLWEHLNDNIRVFCDNVRQWLGNNQSFGARVIRFSVLLLDTARAGVNRVFRAEAINEQGQITKIEERTMTAEEAKAMGIEVDQHKDINVDDLSA